MNYRISKNIQQVSAIIVAAGKSRRMGGVDKIFAMLGGKPILAWSVEAFQNCPSIHQIIVVVSQKNLKIAQKMAKEQGWLKVSDICAGGARRQDSVLAGLNKLSNCKWVLVHDGARPFITTDLIERGLEAAKETGAAVPAVPATDTIKIAGEDKIVQQTLPRHSLWVVQTPQVFDFNVIKEAYRQAKNDVTDDASLVEQIGYKVKIYQGSYDNIKITTPDDLALAEALAKRHGK